MAAHSDRDTGLYEGLYVQEWRPASFPRGVFLLLHGMESHSGWFGETACRLVGDGWAVVAFDRSGWGKSPGPRGHLASYRDFVEETAAIASGLRERYGPVHLAGMSWGGMAALYLGLRRGWLFDSLTFLAPGLAGKRDIGFGDRLRVAADFFRARPAAVVEPAFQPHHFTRNPQWQKRIDEDQARVRRVTSSFCIETVKMRRFIGETAGRRILPPSLCLLADGDEIIDNRRTGELCRKAGATVETLADSAHTLIFDQPETSVARMSAHAAAAADRGAGRDRKVWIVGGGAVGGAVGSLLSFAGVKTGMLVKSSYLPAFTKKGVTLSNGGAKRRSGADLVFADSPDGLPADPDLVVFAVKSFDTAAAVGQIRAAVPARTLVASLQNGLVNEEALAGAFPANTIVAGSICASLELSGPGAVHWADDRGGVGGACHRGDAAAAREVWQAILPLTGMECLWLDGDDASARLKWSKLMLNIGFNALNSATGLPSAALLRDRRYGGLAVQALREGFATMRELSVKPVDLPGFPVAKLAQLLRLPLHFARRVMSWQSARTPEAAFSMRQDIAKKRQHTEIEELNGTIVRIGSSVGVSVSANKKLVDMVSDLMKNS